ncbi:MAG: SDR family oxidoreductase, partial [Terracidiphilus sp.]
KQVNKGSYTIRPGVREDYDALIGDVIKSGYAPRKILHLWSVVKEGADAALEETLELSFYSPLYLAQALGNQDLADVDIALVSNRMQQVAEEPVRAPARAVLLGPAKVIPRELPGITCRSIDVDFESGNARECAARIIAEMASIPENSAVAFRRGERFVETLEPFDLSAAPEHRRLQRGGVYLLTGGLGAIGLVVAEHLAREFNARLVLVGRSALPTEAQWEASLDDAGQSEAGKQTIRKLIEIRSLAGGLMVAQGDVTNPGQMRSIVAEARRRYGKIDGVFHAAGVLDDGPLMLKTAESAARVLDPKVRGTLVLEEALRDEPLSCFVLFSSISSIFPPAGQVDYAAANAFLDAFALSRKEPITAVNWGRWREAGMGVRSASSHPWLEQRLLETPGEIVFASQFSIERHWLLSEHRLKTGNALIPGTGHLEMAAAAFARGSLRGAIEFQDVFFLAPLMFSSYESKEVRVQLKREQEAGAETGLRSGAFRFSIFAKAGEWVEYSTGLIAPCLERPAATIDRAAIAAGCRQRHYVFDEQNRTRQERQFDFGPRWRSLMRLHIGKHEALAEIELAERFSADVSTLRVHPALLDMATGASLYLTEDYEHCDDLFLPISYRRMRVYRPIPGRIFSHVRSRQQTPLRNEIETFDITIFDEQGQVLAEIEGFAMRRIADYAKALENGLARDVARSGGEQPIEIAARHGIQPQEGARALTRILLAATPTAVVAVAQPLEELDTRSRTPSPRAAAAAAPDAAPPGEGVEGTLASWWQDLLGVEKVGLDDDFFALGGHSLVGVRLFVKIKKTYQVDLGLAVLFEARTVRQLADVIARSKQAAGAEEIIWSSLRPIQPHGSRIPLFCVHAVGGDVLFYEQLAKALGPDQPFYAFQSPLIAQRDKRETSIEEMASTYIEEMRAFFPQGPYLLGGTSYGGHIAFEMAKQLHAQGVEPGLLVMIDTAVPGHEERVEVMDQVLTFWRNLRQEGVPYLNRKAAVKWKYWWELLLRRVLIAAYTSYRLAGRTPPLRLHYVEVEEAHWQALRDYTFRPYAGKITLMRAVNRGPEVLGKREDLTLGWGSLAGGGLEIHDVPTGHTSMLFAPNVETFAQMLKAVLPS